jgi:hypothetical protein
MSTPARTLLAAVVYLALLVATAWALDELARWQFTAHLRDQAASALALEARGATPYRWNLGQADDVVAGRVFGAGEFTFRRGQLAVSSAGAAFEVGVPLARAVDIRRFPHLQFSVDADAPGKLRVVVRETLNGPERLSAALDFASGNHQIALDLAALAWTSDSLAVPTPRAAAMLRLRIDLPANEFVHLGWIELGRVDGAQAVDLAQAPIIVDPGEPADRIGAGTAVYRLPLRAQTQKVDIDIIETNINVYQPLLILLPQRGRVEQQIALRNAVFGALPGAILIPESALDASFSAAREQAAVPVPGAAKGPMRWALPLAYALVLAYFRARPPSATRMRALIENLLVLAGPLWLVLGARFDGYPDAPQVVLIGLTLAYAASLSVPRRWRWNGSAKAWLLAGLVVVFALALGLALHRPDQGVRVISPGHVARYLAWALLQQYLICAVCTERWRIVTGNSACAVYLGALGFALLHSPNAALMLATLCGGLCWCALYLRERALLPLAASHAASGLTLLLLLPGEILLSAEVSARFFQ